jgi:hypothetical protein
MSPQTDVVLFDPFEILGSEIAQEGRRFADFLVYPTARVLLERLDPLGHLGVFSLDPDVPLRRLQRLLADKGLLPPIDIQLVAVAQRGDARPFATLLADAGLSAENVVFVSLDAARRVLALADGVRVAPHPSLVPAVLAGHSLSYARLTTRDPAAHLDLELASVIHRLPVVPVLKTGAPERSLYVIAASSAFDVLSSPPFGEAIAIEKIGDSDAVGRTSLVLLQVTAEQARADRELQDFVARLAEGDYPLVRETPNGWLIALPGDRSLDEIHPPPAGSTHGHTLVLLPDRAPGKAPARRVELRPRELRNEEREELEKLDAAAFQGNLASWFGPIEP